MNEDQIMAILYEIHEGLPRGGPGSTECTQRAFRMLAELPPKPAILDIGCGPGMHTLDLAALTNGTIVALDNHQPFLDQLMAEARQHGLQNNIETAKEDMFSLDFAPETFDLIWSEAAIYIVGFEKGLLDWKPLLKPHGYMAISEIAWLRPDPPRDLRDFWAESYPGIQTIDENLATIRRCGYREIGHFVLDESTWWENLYTPIMERLPILKEKYQGHPEALTMLQIEEQEIDLYRRYSEYYGYVFFAMQAD